ncbi:MAG: ABC transporter substrate-binding protein, partial [Thermocrispum sp.]
MPLAVACTTISPERPQAPELKSLRIAVTKTIDSVPLRFGVRRGLFRDAGLDIRLVESGSAAAALRAVVDGSADVGLTCNFTLLRKAAAGAQFQLQGEAYVSGENTMALVSLPGSGYDSPTDKADPVIGVEPHRGLGKLATRMRLATEGVDPDLVTFTELRFGGMMAALRDDRIDAAWMTEPDISKAQKEFGAEVIMDTSRGALLEFP